jgi:hypothetical protein
MLPCCTSDLNRRGEELVTPGHDGLGIVKAQNFNVSDQKAGSLDCRHYFGERWNVAAREDVFGDPSIGEAGPMRSADCGQHHDAVVGEKLGTFGKESIIEIDADMFEHADRDDAVEGTGNVTVIDSVERGVGIQMVLVGAMFCPFELLLRQRDAGNMCAAVFRRIEREPTEATSDVEKPMTFFEEKLCGKVALLCKLSVVEA